MGIYIKKSKPTETKTIIRHTVLYPINLLSLIKSRYIFNKIIEILDETKKLNIICYNEKFKRKLGINLDDYKIMSGKEFIGEKNGDGMERKMEKVKNFMIMVN